MGSMEKRSSDLGKPMIHPLLLAPRGGAGLQLLCLGAHSDDLEIGCSGTILRLLGEFPVHRITWVVFSGTGDRAHEARLGAESIVGNRSELRLVQPGFRDGFFPYHGEKVKVFFECLKNEVNPDIILTHYREDRHQDHRLVSDLTYNTFRNHLILEYEIFKIDGDLGNPFVYVPLAKEFVEEKVRVLIEVFGTQRNRSWFNRDVFHSLLRIRGAEVNSLSGYAEAFYCRKLVI